MQGHVFHPGGQEGKMPAMQHGEVLNIYVDTFLEGDGLVAHPDDAAFLAGKTVAIDGAVTVNADVFQANTPDQAVLEVAVSEVLETGEVTGLRRVIALITLGLGGFEHGAVGQLQVDVVFQTNRVTGIGAGGKVDTTATSLCCRFNGTIDGRRVNGLAVALGAKVLDVVGVGLTKNGNQGQNWYEAVLDHG